MALVPCKKSLGVAKYVSVVLLEIGSWFSSFLQAEVSKAPAKSVYNIFFISYIF